MDAVLNLTTPRPLGEILVAQQLITNGQLRHALELQERDGSRLGDILVSQGYIGYLTLYKALARREGLPFVNLLDTPPDLSLLHQQWCRDYMLLRVLPIAMDGDITVIAVCDVSLEVMTWIRSYYGINTRLVITSPIDIRRVVEQHFGTFFEDESRFALWRKEPQASAKDTLYPAQKYGFALCGFVLVALCVLYPAVMLFATLLCAHIAYSISMGFKCFIFRSRPAVSDAVWQERLSRLDSEELPIYSILIPMYREAESLPQMLKAMHAMDYPATKLDIKLILEDDDHEMITAAQALRPNYRFDIVRVPASQPRTKPKACNYSLHFARGKYVTIYDADDIPDPLQLKKAVWQFMYSGHDVVCLQARLNYYNANASWLTQSFSLEYHILFDYLLKGLAYRNIPIPLGGTSNHIHLERLRKLGDWDPYNVTEDADLGIRITAQGLRTQILDSLTLEEAPHTARAWLKQRSRWIKGYMQTWLVHMRSPSVLYRALGFRAFVGFQLFVGLSSLVFLSVPVVWVLSALWWAQPELMISTHAYADSAMYALSILTAGNFLFYIISQWYFTLAAARDSSSKGLLLAALLYPLYLLLHCIASYKALWQLIVKPHYWEKTMHGLYKKTQKNTR